MLFPKSVLITALCYLSTSSLASTLPSSIQGQPVPDKWFQISLNESTSGNTSPSTRNIDNALVERTPIQVCERIITATAACTVIAGYVISFANRWEPQSRSSPIRATAISCVAAIRTSDGHTNLPVETAILQHSRQPFLAPSRNT